MVAVAILASVSVWFVEALGVKTKDPVILEAFTMFLGLEFVDATFRGRRHGESFVAIRCQASRAVMTLSSGAL